MSEMLTTAGTAQPEGGEAEPHAYGFDPGGWIALAMLVVFGVMLWKRVPAAIGKALDSKIALIKSQLAEAESLRKEAEALKAEYQAKANSAEAEAAAMIKRAHGEADEIVAKAKSDAEGLIARRGRMAEDKIAAEERAAVKQLRAAAVGRHLELGTVAREQLLVGRDDRDAALEQLA